MSKVMLPADGGKRRRDEDTVEARARNNTRVGETATVAPAPFSTPQSEEVLEIAFNQLNLNGMSLGDLCKAKQHYLDEIAASLKQSETYISCHKHIEIIDVAIQRNFELMELYSLSCREMASEPRVKPTLELYQKLREELVVANEKMRNLQQSLAAKSSMSPEAYKAHRARLESELDRVTRLIDEGQAGE
jgi:hypothetical protein